MKLIVIFILVAFSYLLLCNQIVESPEIQSTSSSNIDEEQPDLSQKNSETNNESKSFINDIFKNPIFTAVISAILTFIITNMINYYKNKREIKNNYKCLLITTKNELEFYNTKLEQLSTEADTIVRTIQNTQPVIIPTYSLYPRFLEEIKFKLIKHSINSDIIKEVSNCHFELSHIDERLNLLKQELRSNYNPQIQVANVQGFKGLANKGIIEFTKTVTIIENCKELK